MIKEYKNVELYGDHLKGRKIAFIVGGCTNAYKAIDIIAELRKYNAEIFPYATVEGLKYVTKDTLQWVAGNNIIDDLSSKQFDAIIIYPITRGFIDEVSKKTIKDNIIGDLIYNPQPSVKIIYCGESLDKSKYNIEIINDKEMDIDALASKIVRILSVSYLKCRRILVTAGPTPVKIDNVRRITNKFSGKLGIEIAKELYLRGADVLLLQSDSGIRPPLYVNHILFKDYEEYRELCLSQCSNYEYGIFSAAVADYKPKTVVMGKIPSGGVLTNIELIQTEKVINLISIKNPNLKMISFKYEEGKTLSELIEIANKRLHNGHIRVVANDISLNSDKQKCFLCGLDNNSKTVVIATSEGKTSIARMIVDDLEHI